MDFPYTVEVIQIGDELGVFIPEEIAKILDLQVGDDVTLELNVRGDAVIVRKKKDFLSTNYINNIIWA